MRRVSRLDRVYSAASRQPLLLRLTLVTRVLLSVGFLAPGLTKLLGHRFVSQVTDDAVGVFFENLFQTGLYWRFLGAAQVVAACLVLFRRTSALGALLFLGITLNIFLITLSLGFGNTTIIAALMLLASAYLVLWDYARWKPLVAAPGSAQMLSLKEPSVGRIERIGYMTVIAAGWGATSVMRGLIGSGYLIVFWVSIAVGLIGSLVILLGWILAFLHRRRVGPLS